MNYDLSECLVSQNKWLKCYYRFMYSMYIFQNSFNHKKTRNMSEIDRKSHEDFAHEVKQKADEATTVLENLIQKTKGSNSQEGLSFLDLKNFLVIVKCRNV